MEQIRTKWTARNEYTRPLEGQPDYRSSGVIYALDRHGAKYAVSHIDYERFDEQNFQYVFTPEWGVIDALPPSIFQGIPGLDMSLRLDRYYRVNMTPVFISERTPGEGREDLWELLDSVGLDYYDRFEWLLRTTMRCGTDNLIVERAEVVHRTIHCSSVKQALPADLQPNDHVVISSLRELAGSVRKLRSLLIRILRSGAQVRLEENNEALSEAERSAMLKLLLVQQSLDDREIREARSSGVEQAKRSGKYAGRKRIQIDTNLLVEIARAFDNRQISEGEAMERLGIKSRSTFYRRLKELREPPTA